MTKNELATYWYFWDGECGFAETVLNAICEEILDERADLAEYWGANE